VLVAQLAGGEGADGAVRVGGNDVLPDYPLTVRTRQSTLAG
jgi:hypothetical protein